MLLFLLIPVMLNPAAGCRQTEESENRSMSLKLARPTLEYAEQVMQYRQEMLDNNNIRIAARGVRQDILWKAMRADEKIGLQYASKYSGSSNGWKKWIGEKEAFEALDIIGREKQKEQELEAWIAADPARQAAWGGAIGRIEENVRGSKSVREAGTLLSESLLNIELITLGGYMKRGIQAANAAAKANPEKAKPRFGGIER